MAKRMGRPPLPAKAQRTSPVIVRLTAAQRAKVTRQARKAGYPSVAAYIRAMMGLEPPKGH